MVFKSALKYAIKKSLEMKKKDKESLKTLS